MKWIATVAVSAVLICLSCFLVANQVGSAGSESLAANADVAAIDSQDSAEATQGDADSGQTAAEEDEEAATSFPAATNAPAAPEANTAGNESAAADKDISYPAQTLKATADDAQNTAVCIKASKGVLPADASVKVKTVDDDAIIDAVSAKVEDDGDSVGAVKAFDVTIFDKDGKEIEPEGSVKVTFSHTGLSDDDVSVYHVKENKKGKGYVAEGVKTISANANAQTFETDHFSIYAITDTTANYRLNVVFHKADGSTETCCVRAADTDSDDYYEKLLYDPGAGTLTSTAKFFGWSTMETYTAADAADAMDISEVRDYVETQLPPATDGATLDLYPMFFNVYTVTYLDDDGSLLGTDDVLTTTTENADGDAYKTYTVNHAYSSTTKEFQGWDVTDGSAHISGYVADHTYHNGDSISINGDVTLSANVATGHWLVFEANGEHASYNTPQYVEIGSTTTEPAAPTRSGYTFGGWYTDAACTAGNEFFFGSTLTNDTTVYAKWTQVAQADYTVIIWKQNIDASGYDFVQSVTLQGTPGTTVSTVSSQGSGNDAYARINGTDYKYTGFRLSSFDENVTIAPEGSAIVNVYYDRNTYTLTFQDQVTVTTYTPTTDSSGTQYGLVDGKYVQLRYISIWIIGIGWGYTDESGSWHWYSGTRYKEVTTTDWGTIKTITALYQQNIASNFPIVGTNGKTYNNGERWKAQNSSTYAQVLASMDTMPAENITFRVDEQSDYAMKTMNYWVEVLPGTTGTRTYNGKQFVLRKTVSARYYCVTKTEDYIDIEGFSQYGSDPAFEWNGSYNAYIAIAGSQAASIDMYYSRNSYPITYMDGIYVDNQGERVTTQASRGQLGTSENELFEADLSAYNSGGAKAFAPTYAGYAFEGWYADDACTQPYDFTTMPDGGITVYAKWRQVDYRVFLHPNVPTSDTTLSWGSDTQPMNFLVSYGGTAGLPTGQRDDYVFEGWYTDAACTQAYSADTKLNESTVTAFYDKTTDLTDPMDKYGNITGAGTNADVDKFWVTKKLDLYAKWTPKSAYDTVTVTYDANGGSGAPSDAQRYVDDANVVAQTACTPPNGKHFKCWVVQKWDEASGTYVDTAATVCPGDTFKAQKSLAHQESANVHSYKMQLRAEYGDSEAAVVQFDANGGTIGSATTVDRTYDINDDLTFPADPQLDGCEFLGWSPVKYGIEDTVDESMILNTAKTYGVDTLDSTAWHADVQKNILYAVWKHKFVTITVHKTITGDLADLTKTFSFTATGARAGAATVTFSLGNNATYTIDKVPYGSTVTLSEDNGTYTASYKVGTSGTEQSGASVTLNGLKKNTDVYFTNTYNSAPPTGIAGTTATPNGLVLLVGALLAMAAVAFTRVNALEGGWKRWLTRPRRGKHSVKRRR